MPPSTPTSSLPVILVVDDDAVNRRVASLMVAKMGCATREAAHGADAVEIYRTTIIDLILMDVGMPVMDGLTATQLIRAVEHTTGTRVPILGLSGFSLEADQRDGFAAGMDDYLAKPLALHHLSQALMYWLPGRTHAYGTARGG